VLALDGLFPPLSAAWRWVLGNVLDEDPYMYFICLVVGCADMLSELNVY
jgi:hypothetical protein